MIITFRDLNFSKNWSTWFFSTNISRVLILCTPWTYRRSLFYTRLGLSVYRKITARPGQTTKAFSFRPCQTARGCVGRHCRASRSFVIYTSRRGVGLKSSSLLPANRGVERTLRWVNGSSPRLSENEFDNVSSLKGSSRTVGGGGFRRR